MYVPSNISLVGGLTPITAIDLSLNTFLDISWLVLLPYTLLGIALMIYSQGKLMRGEQKLRRQNQTFDSLGEDTIQHQDESLDALETPVTV